MAASVPPRDASAPGHAGFGLGGTPASDVSPELTQHILDLIIPSKREAALLFLSKHRERFPRLAPLLWWSFGTMSALLQEIVAVYPALTPATLTAPASNRVCNALALLQCVASHKDTRTSFLQANIALYLYPFLRTTSKAKPFEYLRLTSLGVIGALVKQDDSSVVRFLVATEIIPLSLKIMETGSELSKTVAVFILERIVHDKHGLTKVCATQDRFFGVAKVLEQMVRQLEETVSPRLLKHVIRCYERLASHPEACKALRECLPRSLQDSTFHKNLENDRATLQSLTDLVARVRRD